MLLVTLGNAGGVDLEFNGQPVPSLGLPGEVVKDVLFDAHTIVENLNR